ncbi:hypothetical protein HK405_002221, partial [Cladochytrium tenue]
VEVDELESYCLHAARALIQSSEPFLQYDFSTASFTLPEHPALLASDHFRIGLQSTGTKPSTEVAGGVDSGTPPHADESSPIVVEPPAEEGKRDSLASQTTSLGWNTFKKDDPDDEGFSRAAREVRDWVSWVGARQVAVKVVTPKIAATSRRKSFKNLLMPKRAAAAAAAQANGPGRTIYEKEALATELDEAVKHFLSSEMDTLV